MGENYSDNAQFTLSIKCYKQAIQIFEKNNFNNHYINALAYTNLAYNYWQANMMSQCNAYRYKPLEIWGKYYQDDISILSTAYNNAIYELIDYGDLVQAGILQKKFEALMNSHFLKMKQGKFIPKGADDDAHARAMFHLNSIRYYGEVFTPAKIEYHIQQIEQLYEKSPKSWYQSEIGMLLSSYDAAYYYYRIKEYYDKALKYNRLQERLASNEFYKMKSQAGYAMLYYEKRDYLQALKYTEKSLKAMAYQGKGSSIFTLNVLKAELLANLNRPAESIKTLKYAYKLMTDKNKELSSFSIADFGDISGYYHINIFIHSGLAYRQIYECNGKKIADLRTMKNFYKMASAMFERYYNEGIFNPTLDQYLRNIKEGLLYADARIGNHHREIEETINTLERISSQHLWKQFLARNEENLHFPKEIIAKKNDIQLQINDFERKSEKTTEEKQTLQNLKSELIRLNEEVFKKSPQLKRFSKSEFSLKPIQEKIKDDNIIVKYTITDSSVYAHIINQKSIEVRLLGSKKQIETICKAYNEKLRNIDFNYQIESKKIYQLLVNSLKINNIKNYTFITDSFLSALPFETLVTEKNEVLAISRNISYEHALKFMSIDANTNDDFKFNLTGFAPKYNDKIALNRSENGQLFYTGREISEIASSFNKSSIYLDEKATKANFIKTVGMSKIHHLAMHSNLNKSDYEYSNLIFQNEEKMYFHELYNLNFPSELVVLSACNTGVGNLLNGEGLMSISRALNYAGVKASIHSLWQVPDKETAELMTLFYQNLANRMSKVEALAQAKRIFIKNNPSKIHPYYWAGFVLNGNPSPISEENWLVYTVVGILGILTIFLFVFRSKLRQQFQ